MSPPSAVSTAAAGIAAPAQPLEAGARDQLSAAFRTDFSAVRVHVGPEADTAARSLNARAYTIGHDLVFRDGTYDPLTATGRSVIAHELAHVAQHGGQPFSPVHPDVPRAPSHLEQQADAAAGLADSGLPPGWAWHHATSPFIGKVDSDWTTREPYKVPYAGEERIITKEQWSEDDPAVARVDMGEFVVPREKGPWGDYYDAAAKAGALQAQTEIDGGTLRAALWEKRAPPEELRQLWLRRVGWPAAQAATWWNEAGGDPATGQTFAPRAGGQRAQIDHIVELQLGGTNVPENLAPHTDVDNEASGRQIWANLSQSARAVAKAIEQRPNGTKLRNLVLQFSSATQQPGYPDVSPLPQLPADADARSAVIEQRKGKAAKALQVHFTAVQDAEAGTRPSAADRKAAAAALGPLVPYPIGAGPSTARLLLPATPQGEDKIENSEIPENDAARELIAGLVLEKLHRTPQPTGHLITAWLNSLDHPVRRRTRLPLLLDKTGERIPLQVTDVGNTGQLRLQGGSKRVHFTYPYLSDGEMTVQITDAGFAGRGTITPTLPLLRRAPIQITVDKDGLRGAVAPDASKLSLPPFRITDASVNVGLAPELSANGHIGFELGSFVTGGADLAIDARGLVAGGDLRAHIRGLDRSEGHIEYRPHTGLSGYVVAAASRSGSLFTGGEARIDFAGTSWTASGRLNLMLPGGNPAELSVQSHDGRLVYAGRATMTVPGLHPVDVDVAYDGEHVTGSAHTTVALLGMTGDMTLRYREGNFTGEGTLRLQRGRVNGQLSARLDEQGHIFGEGRASLEIRPGLIGTATVVLTPERRLTVSGELRFPPYRFLEQRGDRYRLFHHDLPDIPLFAIPLGPRSIGLVARISAGLDAAYGFGPGEIRDMVIQAGFNPLEEDTNLQASAKARMVLPAYAGLELSLRAGVGLSIAIGSITGGITVTGGVMLRGGLDAHLALTYARSILIFDAEASILVQPVLTLAIDADIVAEAFGLGEHRWPYQIGAWSYATGLQFGLIAPFHYQSDQPLRLPAASDIRWIVPDIDVRALADRIGGQVRAGLGL